MLNDELIDALQAAQAKLDPGAPVYLLIDNELYNVRLEVQSKGRLGPGSVLLVKAALEESKA